MAATDSGYSMTAARSSRRATRLARCGAAGCIMARPQLFGNGVSGGLDDELLDGSQASAVSISPASNFARRQPFIPSHYRACNASESGHAMLPISSGNSTNTARRTQLNLSRTNSPSH